MTIYASKTPRDLNHDPQPWSVGDPRDGRAIRSEREALVPVEWCEFDPRPEYDHAQHNAPNPILVAFRVALGKGATLSDLYDDMTGYQISYPGVDEVQEAWDAAMLNGTFDELNAHAFEILSRVYYATEHKPVNWFTQGAYPSCSCGYAPRDNVELNHHWRGFGIAWVDDHGSLVKKALK